MTINQFISKKECLEAIKNIPKKYSTNRKWNEYLCENIIPRIDNSFFEDENFANKVLKIPYELSDLWIVDDYPSNKKNLRTLDKIFESFFQSSSLEELLEKEENTQGINEYFLRINHHIGEHVSKFQGMLQWDVLMSHFIIYSISEVFYKVCERSEEEIDYFKSIAVTHTINKLPWFKNYRDYFFSDGKPIPEQNGLAFLKRYKYFTNIKMSKLSSMTKKIIVSFMTLVCDHFGKFNFTNEHDNCATNFEINNNKIVEKYLSDYGVSWPDKSTYEEYLKQWEKAFEDHFFNNSGKNINIMFNSLDGILLSNDYQKRKTNKLSHEEYANKIKDATLFRANYNKFKLPKLITT